MNTETIRIPVQATYKIVNGEAVRVDAEFADISVDAFVQYLLRKFRPDKEYRKEFTPCQ